MDTTSISTKRIALTEVESTQIHSIGRDAETNTLAIRFYRGYGRDQVPGPTYHYANVDEETFAAFRDAESLGKHFGQHIKPFADKFPYIKVADDGARNAA